MGARGGIGFAFLGVENLFRFKRYLNEVVVNSLSALGRLYELQALAMPRFVLGASPYVARGDEPLLEALRHVTVQHEHMALQLAEAILRRGRPLPKATYPSRYTSLHCVELRHLLTAIREEQRVVVRIVEELARNLRDDEPALRLAMEVRRNETAHLCLFEELCLRYPVNGRLRRGDRRSGAERHLDSRVANSTRTPIASVHADWEAQVAAWALAG
jgi:hypothetical protein